MFAPGNDPSSIKIVQYAVGCQEYVDREYALAKEASQKWFAEHTNPTDKEPADLGRRDPAAAAALLGCIIYVSGSPTTLAPDTKDLAAGGYILRSVQPLDLFQQPSQAERVALLERWLTFAQGAATAVESP